MLQRSALPSLQESGVHVEVLIATKLSQHTLSLRWLLKSQFQRLWAPWIDRQRLSWATTDQSLMSHSMTKPQWCPTIETIMPMAPGSHTLLVVPMVQGTDTAERTLVRSLKMTRKKLSVKLEHNFRELQRKAVLYSTPFPMNSVNSQMELMKMAMPLLEQCTLVLNSTITKSRPLMTCEGISMSQLDRFTATMTSRAIWERILQPLILRN